MKSIEIPIALFLKLVNSAGDAQADEAIEYIKKYKERDVSIKSISEGFFIDDNKKLQFDENLYYEAVYNEKIKRYSESSSKMKATLNSELNMIKSFKQKSIEYKNSIPLSIRSKKIL